MILPIAVDAAAIRCRANQDPIFSGSPDSRARRREHDGHAVHWLRPRRLWHRFVVPVVAGGDVMLSQPLAPAFASLPEGGGISAGGALHGSGGGLPPLLNPCGGLTPFWQQELQSLPTTIPPTTMGQLIGDLQGIETALTDQGVPTVDQGQVMVPWLKKVVEPPLFQALGVQSLNQLTSVSPTLWQKTLLNPSASSNLVAGLMLAATAADPSALAANAVLAVDPVTGAHYQIQPGQNILWVSEPSASSSVTVPLTPSHHDLTSYFHPMANGQSAMAVGNTTLFVPSSTIPYYQHLSPSALEAIYHGQGLNGQSDQVQVTTHVFTWNRYGSVGVNASAFPLTVYGTLPPTDTLQPNALTNILDTLSFNLPSVTDGTVEGDAQDLGMQLWNFLNKANSYYGDVQLLQNALQLWDKQYGRPQETTFSSPPFTLAGHDIAQIAVDPSAEIINGGAGTADMATLSLVGHRARMASSDTALPAKSDAGQRH